MNTALIRKQVFDLTEADFSLSPIWEFALDEEGQEDQDEATVRPYALSGELDPAEGMFVMSARFALADGTQLFGYLTPPVQGDSGLSTLQPIIIVREGQVTFWYGMRVPKAEAIAKSYSRLGKASAAEVFPIRFESTVPLLGGPVRGEIPGFLTLEDLQTMRISVLT
jgi:hypothetical protein